MFKIEFTPEAIEDMRRFRFESVQLSTVGSPLKPRAQDEMSISLELGTCDFCCTRKLMADS